MGRITQEINHFLALYPEAEFSFAHIVLSDENLSDGNIRYCLQPHVIANWWKHVCNHKPEISAERRIVIRDATIEFLESLLNDYPEEERLDAP